jgi:hypothetical protein
MKKQIGDLVVIGGFVCEVTGGGVLIETLEEKYCHMIVGYIEGRYDIAHGEWAKTNEKAIYDKYILVDGEPVLVEEE